MGVERSLGGLNGAGNARGARENKVESQLRFRMKLTLNPYPLVNQNPKGCATLKLLIA